MVVSPWVDFEGEWTPQEQQILAGAIADVEKWTDWMPLEGRVGKLWLCNCIRLEDLTVYLAHRAGTSKVLYSYGIVELGLDIIAFAMEAQKEAEPVPA